MNIFDTATLLDNWEWIAFGVGVVAIIVAIFLHRKTTATTATTAKGSTVTLGERIKGWFNASKKETLADSIREQFETLKTQIVALKVALAAEKARADQAQLHALDATRHLQASVPATAPTGQPSAAAVAVAKPNQEKSSMQPLTGELEFKMRARVATSALFEADLIAALGGVDQMNAYIKAYGPGNNSQFYDDKLNKQAAFAAQAAGLVPGQMFWGGYLAKKPPQAEVVDGQFWWLPSVMGPFAQFAKPHTRLGAA